MDSFSISFKKNFCLQVLKFYLNRLNKKYEDSLDSKYLYEELSKPVLFPDVIGYLRYELLHNYLCYIS